MKLSIRVRESRGVTILDLSGDFTTREAYIAVRIHVKELLSHNKKILMNLAQVGRIDSGGLGALVEGLLSARKRGGVLKLANLNEEVRKSLEVTNLLGLFETYANEDAALSSFQIV